MPKTLRILVVANKTWECEPLISVLLAHDARPSGLNRKETVYRRGYDPAEKPIDSGRKPPELGTGVPRANLPVRPRLTISNVGHAAVEVWCVEDWMRRDANSSSSYQKFTVSLPLIRRLAFDGDPPALVIAFGTAGIPSNETLNGCVTVGTRVYVHDAWAGASEREIKDQVRRFGSLLRGQIAGSFDRRLDSPGLSPVLFQNIADDVRYAAEARFLAVPVMPATPPRILAGSGLASLGTVNVCDYDDYIWADEKTLKLYERQIRQREIGSMETTHGLIRLSWRDTPFLFVSGLTDRVPLFNEEVTPRKYTQNFAAAHNAGAVVAALIPELARLDTAGLLIQAGGRGNSGARIPDRVRAPARRGHR